MKRVIGQISLPQDHPGGLGGYSQRQSVMLHRYLKLIADELNALSVSSESAGFAPLTTGAEPIELVSDGAGQCVMVPYEG